MLWRHLRKKIGYIGYGWIIAYHGIKLIYFMFFLYSYAIKSNLCHFSNLNSKGVFVVGIFRYWYIFSAFSFVETLF